jgi:heme/copper-type cytochrome/quinol oxidase subunit 2
LTFIADLIYGVYATIFTAIVSLVMFGLLWFVLPIRRRSRHADDEHLPL